MKPVNISSMTFFLVGFKPLEELKKHSLESGFENVANIQNVKQQIIL